MAQQGRFDKLTEEELVELARSKPTVDNTEQITDVDEFIFAYSITPSEKSKALIQNVYWVYRNWSKARGDKPKTKRAFGNQMSKRFKVGLKDVSGGTPQRAYYIENEQFELSVEEWFKMRKYMRNEKNKKTSKRRKVPRTKPQL